MIKQIEITLPVFKRGVHLITPLVEDLVLPLPNKGLLNVFCKHTSAAISINENADPSVRVDLENYLDNVVKENEAYYTHTYEGVDDMPAHIKSSLIGVSLNIPITNNQLNLGLWQGIYLFEFRNNASSRNLICSIYS